MTLLPFLLFKFILLFSHTFMEHEVFFGDILGECIVCHLGT